MTRVTIRVSIFVAIAVTSVAATVDESKWRQNLDSGNQALKDCDYLGARQFYDEAIHLTQPLGPDHPWRAFTLAEVGSLEVVTGNWSQAEQLFVEARRILDNNKLQTLPQYAQVLTGLGVTKTNQGRWSEAEPLLKQSAAAFPEGSVGKAAVLSRLGSLYSAQGRMADALALFNQAITVQRRALPGSLYGLLFSLEALGSSWFAQGRYDQAEIPVREAWQLSRELPPSHPARAESETYLASTLLMQGKAERALPLLKSALSIYERGPGGRSCQLGPLLTTLARLDTSERHYAMAEEKLQRVLSIFEQCYPPGHVAVGFAQVNLAQLYLDQQKYEQARPLMERALQVILATYPGGHPSVIATLYEEARLEAGLRNFDQADTHFRESIDRYEKTSDPHDPRLGSMLHTYAAFLKKVHRNSEAKPLEARAKSIFAFQHKQLRTYPNYG